ncbi:MULTISPECIES: type 4 pilus major pilin [Pseudomonas]|uniref:Type 4 secretion system PilS N-terminal domain-containing protein n=1 Tax=Pseudomonas veronii TaxID=76761 RepID=A0A7Y1A917_PSEVE|nr:MULTISPECIES: type 4 pilus major pilin [Pseudomonas]NMY11307.1 hypothetical protein [Pseudomonas veronii]
MKLKHSSKNNGLTLIEALIWFAIFAAVVAGIFALYSNARNASNSSTVNKELSTIFSQTEQLFASEDTKDLDKALALKMGVFPKSVKVSSSGVISNVFGGTIEITGQTPSGFTVTYTGVPSGEVCSNIVRAQKAVGWDTVEGKALATYDSTYSISQVGSVCGDNGGEVTDLVFIRLGSNT